MRGLVGDDVEIVVIPLQARFILQIRIEDVEPSGLQRVVKRVDGAAVGKAGKRGYVGAFFAIVAITVAKVGLVIVAELVVETAGSQIFSRAIRKKTAVVFEIIDEEGVRRICSGIERENTSKRGGAESCG